MAIDLQLTTNPSYCACVDVELLNAGGGQKQEYKLEGPKHDKGTSVYHGAWFPGICTEVKLIARFM